MTTATTWTAPVGAIGFDTSGAVTSQSQAQAIYAAGYRFAIRYVTVPGNPQKPDVLTAQEAEWLLGAGIAIGIVQMYQIQANINAQQGTTDGQSAASQAAKLGAPTGMVLWCDVEGVSCNQNLIDYLNNWAAAVTSAGYAPGVYNAALTTTSYCNQVQVNHWWLSGAGMQFKGNIGSPSRGYQMLQCNPPNQVVSGLAIDVDATQDDNNSWAAVFWAPSSSVSPGGGTSGGGTSGGGTSGGGTSGGGTSGGGCLGPGNVVTFTTGTLGIDKTGAPIPQSSATELYRLGYRFALRSIGVPTCPSSQQGELTQPEIEGLWSAGMAVSVFQLNFKQATITAAQGTADGNYLVQQVSSLGFPSDARPPFTLWFDLEGSMNGASAKDLNAYMSAWATAVTGAGYGAGLYVGKNKTFLNVQDPYSKSPFSSYWQAGGYLYYGMPLSGYQMYQLWPLGKTIAGIPVDIDVVQEDFDDGNVPFWGS